MFLTASADIETILVNTTQAARYARIGELIREFDQPNGVFSLAESIGLIETAWDADEQHFVRIAFIEVIMALVNRRLYLDVAQALVAQMLAFDRERNSLMTAARVAEWAGDASLADALKSEAASAPDKLPVTR